MIFTDSAIIAFGLYKHMYCVFAGQPTKAARRSTGNWLDIIAKSLPDAKPKEIAEEDLNGLKEMFATPEDAAKKIKVVRKRSSNWLDAIAKTLRKEKPKRSSSSNFEGLQEMFSTPTSTCNDSFSLALMSSPAEKMNTPSLRAKDSQISVHVPVKASKTPSLRQAATVRNACMVTPMARMIEAIDPNKTPSLRSARRSDETFNLALMLSPVQQALTPSLRSKESQFLQVEPLPASQTPSLRKAGESVEVVQAIEPTKTPSLRSSTAVEIADLRTSWSKGRQQRQNLSTLSHHS